MSLGVLLQVTKKSFILRALTLCNMVSRQNISGEHPLLPFLGKWGEDRGTRFLLTLHASLSNYTGNILEQSTTFLHFQYYLYVKFYQVIYLMPVTVA